MAYINKDDFGAAYSELRKLNKKLNEERFDNNRLKLDKNENYYVINEAAPKSKVEKELENKIIELEKQIRSLKRKLKTAEDKIADYEEYIDDDDYEVSYVDAGPCSYSGKGRGTGRVISYNSFSSSC